MVDEYYDEYFFTVLMSGKGIQSLTIHPGRSDCFSLDRYFGFRRLLGVIHPKVIFRIYGILGDKIIEILRQLLKNYTEAQNFVKELQDKKSDNLK